MWDNYKRYKLHVIGITVVGGGGGDKNKQKKYLIK